MGKPILDKAMTDYFGETGLLIKSRRLVTQAETYVHLSGTKTGAEKGSMNDDLVLASALAFIGINLAISRENSNLVPFLAGNMNISSGPKESVVTNDYSAVTPIGSRPVDEYQQSIDSELGAFTNTLMAPFVDSRPAVREKKKQFK
jgi:hypothetical protein